MPRSYSELVTELGFESGLSDFNVHVIPTKIPSFTLSTNIYSSNKEPMILQVKTGRDRSP